MPLPYLCITFHGSSHPDKYNNIWAYPLDNLEKDGIPILNTSTLEKEVLLRELRDFKWRPDGKLYVIVANKDNSKLLSFVKSSTPEPSFDFEKVFAKDKQGRPYDLQHPFQMVFSPEGDIYVSSQNSNRVYRFFGSHSKEAGLPMPVPAHYADLDLPMGTFIPSLLDAKQQHKHQGLLKKVRGIGFGPDGNLYVADEKIPAVNVYDGHTGAFIKTLIGAKSFLKNYKFIPNHLMIKGDYLYVADRDNNCVYQMNVQQQTPFRLLIDRSDKKHTHAGGIQIATINGRPTFLWGQRKKHKKSKLVSYSFNENEVGKSQSLLKKLEDEPEFIKVLDL